MKIIPSGNNLLVQVEKKKETVTKTGIVLTKDKDEKGILRGKVIGHGIKDNLKWLNKEIFFTDYSADKIDIEDVELYIIDAETVLATIE